MAINPVEINPLYTKRKYSVTDDEKKLAEKDPEKFIEISHGVEYAQRIVEKENAQSFIRPETEADKLAARKDYDASLKSLDIELAALATLTDEIFSDADPIKISIYGAKVEGVREQIGSLDKVCRNKGNTDLDKLLDEYKVRFEEYKMVDIEKLKQGI